MAEDMRETTTSIEARVREIADVLGRCHGQETWVTDGHAYFDDLIRMYTELVRTVEREALEQAKNYAASKYNPGSAAEAVAIEAYKVGFNNGRQEALGRASKIADAEAIQDYNTAKFIAEAIRKLSVNGDTQP